MRVKKFESLSGNIVTRPGVRTRSLTSDGLKNWRSGTFHKTILLGKDQKGNEVTEDPKMRVQADLSKKNLREIINGFDATINTLSEL